MQVVASAYVRRTYAVAYDLQTIRCSFGAHHVCAGTSQPSMTASSGSFSGSAKRCARGKKR
eukprot:2168551-Pleurochrysis_carterae.AAC.1